MTGADDGGVEGGVWDWPKAAGHDERLATTKMPRTLVTRPRAELEDFTAYLRVSHSGRLRNGTFCRR
jgi:hypothetical protein